MKKLVLEKYKLLNISFVVVSVSIFIYINTNYKTWVQDADINYIYEMFDGIYNPVMVGSMWLSGILSTLLLFPSKIFKKWLFFVAPPILLLTFVLVKGISVYSGNLLNPTRAQMAENGMILLSVVTALLVVGHLLYDWKKKRRA